MTSPSASLNFLFTLNYLKIYSMIFIIRLDVTARDFCFGVTPPLHVQIRLWPLTLLISFIITRTSAKIDNGWINLQRLRKIDYCHSPMNTDDSIYRYKTTRTSEPAVRRKHEGKLTFDRQKVWPRWRRPFMYGYGKVTKYFSLLNVGMTEDSVLGILAGSSFSVQLPTHLPMTLQC